jgi:hypothetical protein
MRRRRKTSGSKGQQAPSQGTAAAAAVSTCTVPATPTSIGLMTISMTDDCTLIKHSNCHSLLMSMHF